MFTCTGHVVTKAWLPQPESHITPTADRQGWSDLNLSLGSLVWWSWAQCDEWTCASSHYNWTTCHLIMMPTTSKYSNILLSARDTFCDHKALYETVLYRVNFSTIVGIFFVKCPPLLIQMGCNESKWGTLLLETLYINRNKFNLVIYTVHNMYLSLIHI